MSEQSAAATELVDMVHLNEGIKEVVVIAFQINIMALNAILLANRAGRAALGFSVISKELRVLSVELTRLMQLLKQDAYRSVALITDLLRQERRAKLMQTANALSGEHCGALKQRLGQQKQAFSRIRSDIRQYRRELRVKLDDAQKICQFGIAISRSAKIEAAYGAAYSNQLSEVSQDFDQNIQAIVPALAALHDGLGRQA